MTKKRDPKPTPPCSNCGTTWRHSDRIGCCSGCRQAFAGLAAFDAHQVGPRDEHGRKACVDAETAIYPQGHPRYEQRVFRPVAHGASNANGQLWALTPTAEAAERMLSLSEHRRQAREAAAARAGAGAA